jgi:hypothetical protein
MARPQTKRFKESNDDWTQTTICFSLVSALMFCALAAQGASAAEAKNTTAVTCVKNGGLLDFKDAHCDETVEPGTGEFGHVELTNTVEGTTEIHITTKKPRTKQPNRLLS